MATKGIYIDESERVRRDYQMKLLLNGLTMADHLRKYIREYTYGKRKAKSMGIKPLVGRIKGVKFTKKF